MNVGSFLLRDMHSALNAMSASDKVMIVRKGTVDADGEIVVDVHNDFRVGASLMYTMFTPVTVAADGTFTADTDPVKSGEVVVAIVGGANDLQIVGG